MIDKLHTILLGSHVTWVESNGKYVDSTTYAGVVVSVYVKDDEFWLTIVFPDSGRIREIESKYCTVVNMPDIKYIYGEYRPYMPSATLQMTTHPDSFSANFGR
jgi:hypothetical protein